MIKELLQKLGDGWQRIRVAFAIKLLGVFVGLDAGLKSWTSPIIKHNQRITMVRSISAGLSMSAVLYNYVSHSTL